MTVVSEGPTPVYLPEKYTFDFEFQRRVLGLMVQKPDFVLGYREVLDPNYFEGTLQGVIATCLLKFYDDQGKVPQFYSLKEELRRSGLLKDTEIPAAYAETLELSKVPIIDTDYIKKVAVEFGAHQAIKRAILISSGELSQPAHKIDYDKIALRIDEARRAGQDKLDIGRFYLAQHNDRKGGTALQKLGLPIASAWKSIDGMLSGGLYPTQLGIIVAPPKRGKTCVCVNLAAVAMMLGKRVVYYTCELAGEVIEERIDQRVLGKTREEVQRDWALAEARFAALSKRSGEIVVKFFPMFSTTVRGVRDHLRRVQQEKQWHPDLVIVDYGAIMKPSRTYKDSSYATVGGVYQDLKGLAQNEKLAIWSPLQTNRGALTKDTPTEFDMAESFIPAQVCDATFFMCQTAEELLAHKMRLFLGLNRNGPQGVSVRCDVDHARQMIREDQGQQGPPSAPTA